MGIIIKQRPFFILLLVVLVVLSTAALQSQVSVVTKEINRSISLDSKKIIINAEKANVIITQSTDQTLYLKLKLIAKHKNADIAREQLEFLKYLIRENRNDVFLRNYISVSSNSELQASIKAVYYLKIPKNTSVQIENTLGEIKVSNTVGQYAIDLKYGKLIVEGTRGKLKSTIHIGDLFINNSNLNAEISTNHTSSNILNPAGSYTIKSNLGSVNFEISKGLSKLMLVSNGTEINLNNKQCLEFNLDIVSDYGSIFINKCGLLNSKNILVDTRRNTSKKQFKYLNTSLSRLIKITNKHSTIYLN